MEDALPIEEVPPWVYKYCSQPDRPVRLLRRQPDAQLWFSVLTRQRSIDSLEDTEVKGLSYLLRGGWHIEVAGHSCRLLLAVHVPRCQPHGSRAGGVAMTNMPDIQ